MYLLWKGLGERQQLCWAWWLSCSQQRNENPPPLSVRHLSNVCVCAHGWYKGVRTLYTQEPLTVLQQPHPLLYWRVIHTKNLYIMQPTWLGFKVELHLWMQGWVWFPRSWRWGWGPRWDWHWQCCHQQLVAMLVMFNSANRAQWKWQMEKQTLAYSEHIPYLGSCKPPQHLL